MRWRHAAPREQHHLPPFAPDVDSTALALLIFLLAEKEGINVQEGVTLREQMQVFDELIHPNGIKTWFENFCDEEPDPVVTSAVALLELQLQVKDKLYYHLQEVWNKVITNIEKLPQATIYYLSGKAYLLARTAQMLRYDATFLQRNTKDSLDQCIETMTPVNPLEAAWIGSAAAKRQLKNKMQETKEYLERSRQGVGLWPWTPFYNQKTYWVYGHEVITTLYAIEALKNIEAAKIK